MKWKAPLGLGPDSPDEAPLSDFRLSARALNCMKNMGLKTAGDVRRISDADLAAFPNLGVSTFIELRTTVGPTPPDDWNPWKLSKAASKPK